MAQGDYLIQNQSFPSFRSDLNSTLEAINTSNSGTSRPSSAVAGTVWLDVTNATNPTLKFFDGTDDISLATLDYTANTVNWLDSTVVADLVNDTTPQLGGNLDVNGNSIVSVSNGNITFTPDGTGKVIIDGLSYPTADGTNGQALITDGSGNLSFGDVAGGTNTPSFRAYLVGSVSVADVTNTVVPYDTENFDTDSAYDTSTYRFTVPSGKAGKYFFSAHAYIFQSSASLYSCDFQIRKNGANQSFDQISLDSSDNFGYNAKSTTILDLSVGDYVDVNIIGNTNDGGNFTIFGISPYNWTVFQGFKLL